MPRLRKDERAQSMAETRERILDASAAAFAALGYDKANVNHIARDAGLSIGTVYNYFPSKRDLMLAFIEETSQLHVSSIIEQVMLEEDPERRIEIFFQAGFAFVEDHVTPSRAIFNALNGPDEDFKAQLFAAYQPLFQLLGESVLGQGIARNLFRQLDPGRTANLLMLIYLGACSQLSPEGKPWVGAGQVSEFVLHAVRQLG